MDLGIRGRTALVTGGDSGIGWQTAKLLLQEGATVVISDIKPNRLEIAAGRLREQLGEGAGEVHAIAADLSTDDGAKSLAARVDLRVGDIDILVHAAGIPGAQGRFHEIDDAGWVDTLTVDLLAPVRVTRAVLPALRRGGWGRIVYLTSEDATQPDADELPYCAAKAAVLTFAKGLSRSYVDEGLLVNCVSPAFIHTPMTDTRMVRRSNQLGVSVDEAIAGFLDEERPHLELRRRGEPAEVAAVVAFLCSDRASFVNGSNYRVDAGSVASV